MSATMRQGLATLLVAKTNTARKKGSDLFFNVRKDLGAAATHAEHKQYSDLIAPVDKQLFYAETLLHKGEASYFDSLDVLRNLEILQTVTRDIGALPNRYAQRQQLAKQLKEAEERHSKCEAEKKSVDLDQGVWIGYRAEETSPGRTYYYRRYFAETGGTLLFAGYFVVGYIVGNYEVELERRDVYDNSVRLVSFFIWPLFTGIRAVLHAVFDGDFDLILALLRAIFLGLIPAAIGLGVVAIKRITNDARYNAQRARYNKVQQRLKLLSDEHVKLSTEISRTRSNLGGVDHEISEYRHRIAQNIGEIKWK